MENVIHNIMFFSDHNHKTKKALQKLLQGSRKTKPVVQRAGKWYLQEPLPDS